MSPLLASCSGDQSPGASVADPLVARAIHDHPLLHVNIAGTASRVFYRGAPAPARPGALPGYNALAFRTWHIDRADRSVWEALLIDAIGRGAQLVQVTCASPWLATGSIVLPDGTGSVTIAMTPGKHPTVELVVAAGVTARDPGRISQADPSSAPGAAPPAAPAREPAADPCPAAVGPAGPAYLV